MPPLLPPSALSPTRRRAALGGRLLIINPAVPSSSLTALDRFSSSRPPHRRDDDAPNRRHNSTLAKQIPGLGSAAVVSYGGTAVADFLGLNLLKYQGVISDVATTTVKSPISGIPVSILLGVALNNFVFNDSVKKTLAPGLGLSTKAVLQIGIVLVGLKLSALDLLSTGLYGIPCVAASITAGMTFIPWFGNYMGLSPKMSSLIAAGSSICGVTAITAVAPAIKADEKDASFAIANVVAFGTLGMLSYPYLVGPLFNYNSQALGIFFGLAVHDTSQVMGSALTYSTVHSDAEVLKVAAVTKLTRNLCLTGVVPYLAVKHGASSGGASSSPSLSSRLSDIKKNTPLFVTGFVCASLLRTTGDIAISDPETLKLWKQALSLLSTDASQVMLGTAMAAVGMSTKLSSLRGVGVKPFVVGFSGAAIVGGTGFATASAMNFFFFS